MADLSSLTNEDYQPNEGAILELNGIDGAPLFCDDGTRMTLTLLGRDSDVVIQHNNKASNRRLAAGARMKLTSEGIQGEGAALLAKATVGWNVQIGSEKPACSYDAAFAIYNNPKLAFIREQADEFVGDRSHFLRPSQTS